MQPIITQYPTYFTATNLEWKKLLQPDMYKDIVISSMKFLVKDKRVKIFSFVIMDNHIHLTCLQAGRYGKCFQIMTPKPGSGIFKIYHTKNKKGFTEESSGILSLI